jgi:hypothetical protein
MSVHCQATNRRKKPAVSGLPRIVRYVRYKRFRLAGKFGVQIFGDFLKCRAFEVQNNCSLEFKIDK